MNLKKSFLENHKYTIIILINFGLLAILKDVYAMALAILLIIAGLINIKKYLPFSVLILSIMLFLNPFLGPLPSPEWNLALLIFASLFIIKQKFHTNKLEVSFLAILLSFLLTSLLSSSLLSIAVVKVISLTIFSYVVFRTFKWGYIDEGILRQIVESIVIANFVFNFLPDHGYYKNGLFMGVFNHSQSIGIFLVPLLMYYTISFLEKYAINKYERLFTITIILIGIYELFATFSRTAIFTYIVLITIYIIMSKVNIKNIVLMFNRPLRLIVAIFLVSTVFYNLPKIIDTTQNYIYKSYSNDVFQSQGHEHILDSRQELFQESYNNFKQKPLLGNGFGVQYNNGQLSGNKLRYLPVLNVPYTMVNEKGNVYMMVLEEGGLVTFIAFLLFIFILLNKTRKYLIAFFPTLAILIMFNGEATFFSLNGTGAFQFVFLILLYYMAIQNKFLESSK